MWTEKKEKLWNDLAKQREENKETVGRMYTIKMLQKMIQSLEAGDDLPGEIKIEFIRGPIPYASSSMGPVIGKQITLTYR